MTATGKTGIVLRLFGAVLLAALVAAGISAAVLNGRLQAAVRRADEEQGRMEKAQRLLAENPHLVKAGGEGRTAVKPDIETLRTTVDWTVNEEGANGRLAVMEILTLRNGVEVRLQPARASDIIRFVALVESRCSSARTTSWHMNLVDGESGTWKVTSLLFKLPEEK